MKNWKYLGLFCLLFLTGIAAKAQNDVVHLKNGSFIRGTIIEYIAGDHVKIKTEEGKIYEFSAAELAKAETGGSPRKGPKLFTFKTKGYYNITSLGFMFGNHYGLKLNPGLYTVNGWQWNEHLMTGLGLGIEYLDYGGKIPITAEARWNFLKGAVTPFAGLSAGYTVPTGPGVAYVDWWGGPMNNKNYGGITTGLNFGIRSYSGPHVGLTFQAGYRFQKFKTRYDETFWLGTEPVTHEVIAKSYLQRFTLGFGLLFN
jgi:hypothetical protein